MSAETVKQIIARAVTEPEFRGVLFSQPAHAFAGYDLTEAEKATLQGLTPQEFDSLAGTLDDRISRAGLGSMGVTATATGIGPTATGIGTGATS